MLHRHSNLLPMKTCISALFLIVLPASVFAAEEARPRFQQIAAFLTWADKNLAADNYETLITAQVDAKDTRETKLAYVKQLDVELGKAKLAKIFEGREFPKEATTFTLGGHEKELGHCHIDFLKKDDAWQVARIWHCR